MHRGYCNASYLRSAPMCSVSKTTAAKHNIGKRRTLMLFCGRLKFSALTSSTHTSSDARVSEKMLQASLHFQRFPAQHIHAKVKVYWKVFFILAAS
jgi:hypothetical protein